MALTRKMLKAMGIEEEKIEQIIEAHAETVEALKKSAEDAKAQAAGADEVKKELEALKEKGGDDFKARYEKEHAELEKLKADTAAKETRAAKESAYRELLRGAGISEKRIGSVLRVADLDGIELENGKIKDSEKLSESIKTEWADFIETPGTVGAPTPTPKPSGAVDYDSMSDDEYYAAKKAEKKG